MRNITLVVLVRSIIYGAEYETYSQGIFPSSLSDHDVPCACHVAPRASQMMIPGRNVWPAGWTTIRCMSTVCFASFYSKVTFSLMKRF